MRPGSNHFAAKGFTLVELTIVLLIVGLLMGGMMVSLSAQVEQRDYNETRRQLNEIREALIGFAIVHGRLPRPAASASDGLENPANCVSDADCTGFIPWTTLGVKGSDAWNKLILYSVTPSHATNAASLLPANYGSKKVKTRNGNGDAKYLIGDDKNCGSSPDGSVHRCAPAVILSFGKNNWGTTPDGIALPDDSSTNADEDANARADREFFARDPSNASSTPGGEFDDLLVWVPPYILFNRMAAAGRLP